MPLLSIEIPFDPVAFHFGWLSVRWYGLGYVLAIAVGLTVIKRYAPERGIQVTTVENVAVWAIPAGLIGGRLYYVIQNDPGKYLADPRRIFAIWEGGMAFFGAIIAVSLVVLVFGLLRRGTLFPMLDVAAIFAIVGQPFGRLGNVINGDIIGKPTDVPWGFIYTHPDSFAPSSTVAYHPAAIYEILANIVLFALIWPLRNRLAPGMVAACYLAGYSISQLVVFAWRSEPIVLFGLRQAQVTALCVLATDLAVVAGVAAWRHRGQGDNNEELAAI